MPNDPVLSRLTKAYLDNQYTHTAMVRHKGTVIAFAMNDRRRIFYAVQDMSPAAEGSAPKSPLDVNNWPAGATELRFPREIAEVGYGVADQTQLPLYKNGKRTPETPGKRLADKDTDFFLSTTARFTADFPFQVMSDGNYIYLFRQAIQAGHADMAFKLDQAGTVVNDSAGNPVPLVNATLLVDRFVLVGTRLTPKLEVRFQRSRSKTRPQSRKDGLGAKDLDGNAFYEPTQELKFVGNLKEGRFAALLIPTQIAGLERWQIFAQNAVTGRIDSCNVERAKDGLFNTRGSQVFTCTDHPEVFAKKAGKCVEPGLSDPAVMCDKDLVPRISKEGYAESALRFASESDKITLQKDVVLGDFFTIEAWLKPGSMPGTDARALITGSAKTVNGGPSVRIDAQTKLTLGFSDGSAWREFTSKSMLTPDEWNHLAVTFDGSAVRFYIDGKLREKKEADNAGKPLVASTTAAAKPVKFIGGTPKSFIGAIDELRCWNRARTASELQNDLHQRLTGLEPGLAAYWRFDEARDDRVYDQTNNNATGAITGGVWVSSDAPVGENPGINRSCFQIVGPKTANPAQTEVRSIASGMSTLLYFQQANVPSGYDGKDKPMKQNARVMLAVATKGSEANARPLIAVLDFGVSNSGRFAQIPDNVNLSMVDPVVGAAGSETINDSLNRASALQLEVKALDDEIGKLEAFITRSAAIEAQVNDYLANPLLFSAEITDKDFKHLNKNLKLLKDEFTAWNAAKADMQALNDAQTITVYKGFNFTGAEKTFPVGEVPYNTLILENFNDQISSIKMLTYKTSGTLLEVDAYQNANRGGSKLSFTGSISFHDIATSFNDVISHIDVKVQPGKEATIASLTLDLAGEITAHRIIYNGAQTSVSDDLAKLIARKTAKGAEKATKTAQRDTLNTQLSAISSALSQGLSVPMPLIEIDPFGLSVSGGLLKFAWTNDIPRLFDSATGKLSLYFRGTDDQFFVAYYDTFTDRAKYPLTDAALKQTVICVARSTDLDMDKIVLEISEGDVPDTCTVSIAGAGIEETWRKVPRNPEKFTRVLNGEAGHYEAGKQVGYREYVGSGQIVADAVAKTLHISAPGGIRRALDAGSALMIGKTRVFVKENVAANVVLIPVTSGAGVLPEGTLPVYYMEYDYDANTSTTKVPGDLFGGSLLLSAVNVGGVPAPGNVTNQRSTSGATLSTLWKAAVPGNTLVFDGATNVATPAAGVTPDNFSHDDDLTLEAWVRPTDLKDRVRVLQHRTANSNYALGLTKKELNTALEFDGANDFITIDGISGLDAGNSVHTIEAWLRLDENQAARSWPLMLGKNTQGAHHWLIKTDGTTQIGVRNGIQLSPELPLNKWTHIASVFDGSTLSVYINGVQFETGKPASFNLQKESSAQGLALTIAKKGSNSDQNFKGQMDEVRIWKRARTRQEILTDMNRRLSGLETGLVGYWHFDNGLATDFSRFRNDGTISGAPKQAVSPLQAYSFFAGVNGKFVEAKEVVPAGNWTHLAAVFSQSYGLKFDGASAYLDCGNDESLNIDKDLTIEVFLKIADSDREYSLVSRGRSGSGTSQKLPYAVTLKRGGKLEFSFEDIDGNMHRFISDQSVGADTKWVAVTRKWKTFTYKEASTPPSGYTFGWYEIGIHIEGKASQTFVLSYDNQVESAIQSATSATPTSILINQLVSDHLPNQLSPVGIGRSKEATLIGKSDADGGASKFKGIITELRIWSAARDSAGADIFGNEDGLVTWLRFQERSGVQTKDWAGQNHAKINGNAEWVKDPDLSRSPLALMRDDSDALATVPLTGTGLAATSNQFQLGAFKQGTNTQEHFQGELEEVRIWKTARTQEQIQDNLFRRIGGELEDLIAYYAFDAETGSRISDNALLGNHLAIQGTALFIYSTAPIGEDAPQVRSALAGVRTPFSGLIGSAPAVHEYADLQYDSNGNMIGVFKRSYAYLRNRQLDILTAFKVGDMSVEWIGQVQFAPQLIGFIEGAPPVPSENLTMPSVEMVGDLDDYNEASTVEFVEAQQTTHAYSATKEAGFDMAVELALGFGFKSQSEAGIGFISSVEESKVMFGLRAQFEASWSWQEEAGISDTRSTGKTTSLELRGRYTTPEENINEPFGRRFIPDNVGLALVQSRTADVFALRLKQNNALISFTMQPNPDIPKDWNLITFPINPRYVKQGTLDGKIGPVPDVDYPNALNYSPDSSYFKPVEAYALKNRINREETELENYYNQFNAQGKGRPAGMPSESAKELAGYDKLSDKLRRNLVNTYVWTADGGLFAETQQTMEVRTESFGGSYDFKGMGGIDLKIGFAIAKVASRFELSAMFGGHQHLNVSQSKESQYSFELNINLDKVERDIYLRTPEDSKLLQLDRSDPKRPKPIKHPYKVDAYRFMSFYLEPDSNHFDLFFQSIVDPIWLEQSGDPGAAALREARQEGKKPACWRIMHRVTYVSRVLPPLDNSAPPSLEKALQTLDIDSNYELIKQLEPFVGNKLASYTEFTEAIRSALRDKLPELKPHETEVIKYMTLYYGIPEGLADSGGEGFGEETLAELAPNQPPIVNAGADQIVGLDGPSVFAELDATVIDDRLEKTEAIFATWEKISGAGDVTFDDPHAVSTRARFTRRGRYVLRITAHDGMLSASDDLTVVVNERPVVSAGSDQEILARRDAAGNLILEAALFGEIVDDGRGDPNGGLTAVWTETNPGATPVALAYSDDDLLRLRPAATFPNRGLYLLKLTVQNDSFSSDDEVAILVAARAKNQLLALYTFEEGSGTVVHDVSGTGVPLDLAIGDPTKANWIANGLSLTGPAALVSDAGASRITDAIKASNELTIEAWIKPASDNVEGLARIVTLSGGPAVRNFTIGQRGAAFHAHLRSTGTNLNASNQAMAGGSADTGALMHLVCTRDAAGITRLFVNGRQVSRRVVSGDFSNWDSSFRLALGDEFNSTDWPIRTWRGEYHLVAIYSRALSVEEIAQNFDFGADANLPPVVTAGPDLTVNWPDWTDATVPQPASVSASLDGRITHDRVSPLQTTRWMQVGGPESPSGVVFTPDNTPATTAVFREKGRYVLRLSSSDGALLMNDDVVVVVNRPPQVVFEHGTDLKFALTAAVGTIQLEGKLNDSGLGDESAAHAMTYRWSLASGPATAVIEHPDQLSTSVRFTGRGIYELMLEANNGFVSSRFRVGVVVSQRPVISASDNVHPGIEQMYLPATQITLSQARVIDNGLGDPADALVFLWEKVSGEGTVTFIDPTVLYALVRFSQNGVYVLRLTARHPHHLEELTASSEFTMIINQAPVVDAGADPAPLFLDLTRPGSANVAVMLDGTASDDGLPGLPGVSGLPALPYPGLVLLWSKESGPGAVQFTSPDMDYTEARFTQKGKYVLKLQADDGHLRSSDTVTVIVNATPRVEAGNNRKVITTPLTPPGSTVMLLTLPLNGTIVDDGVGDPPPLPALPPTTTVWELVSGPALPAPGIAAPDNPSTEATLDKNGTYEFKFTARNGFGDGFDSIFITAFGLSQVEMLDEPGGLNRQFKFSCKIGGVLIDAANLDGLSFEWSRFRVPTGVSAPQISTPNGPDTLIQFRGRGEHEIQLTITDAAGTSIAKRATITIV